MGALRLGAPYDFRPSRYHRDSNLLRCGCTDRERPRLPIVAERTGRGVLLWLRGPDFGTGLAVRCLYRPLHAITRSCLGRDRQRDRIRAIPARCVRVEAHAVVVR